MQKVLQVNASGTDRSKTSLATAIEKSVSDFVSSVNGILKEFVINDAEVNPQGFGHALVTVSYEPGVPKLASHNSKKGGEVNGKDK